MTFSESAAPHTKQVAAEEFSVTPSIMVGRRWKLNVKKLYFH